jgi:hypothetical protein
MSEWVQENRRAVVMLAVAMSIALLAALYAVLSGGDSTDDLPPVTRGASSESVVTEDTAAEEAVVEVQPAVRVYSGRGTNANPFAPVDGENDGTDADATAKPTSKPTPKPTSNASTPNRDPAVTTTRSEPSVKQPTSNAPSTSDPGNPSEPDDPQPVVPEPIGGPGKDGEELLVRVLEVQPELMTARVNGERTKLYLNEPNELGGLTYLAPLGGGCAWVGMPDTEVRFSVCKGKTERL